MKLIKMLSTKKGAEDGIRVKTYKQGENYNMNPALAEIFLKNKWAETFDKNLSERESLKAEEIEIVEQPEAPEEEPKKDSFGKGSKGKKAKGSK